MKSNETHTKKYLYVLCTLHGIRDSNLLTSLKTSASSHLKIVGLSVMVDRFTHAHHQCSGFGLLLSSSPTPFSSFHNCHQHNYTVAVATVGAPLSLSLSLSLALSLPLFPAFPSPTFSKHILISSERKVNDTTHPFYTNYTGNGRGRG